MGDEGSGRRATRYYLHHRCFDFHEIKRFEILSYESHDARAGLKDITRLFIHDEVDIALSVTHLGVG